MEELTIENIENTQKITNLSFVFDGDRHKLIIQ